MLLMLVFVLLCQFVSSYSSFLLIVIADVIEGMGMTTIHASMTSLLKFDGAVSRVSDFSWHVIAVDVGLLEEHVQASLVLCQRVTRNLVDECFES